LIFSHSLGVDPTIIQNMCLGYISFDMLGSLENSIFCLKKGVLGKHLIIFILLKKKKVFNFYMQTLFLLSNNEGFYKTCFTSLGLMLTFLTSMWLDLWKISINHESIIHELNKYTSPYEKFLATLSPHVNNYLEFILQYVAYNVQLCGSTMLIITLAKSLLMARGYMRIVKLLPRHNTHMEKMRLKQDRRKIWNRMVVLLTEELQKRTRLSNDTRY
ncbi:hypothetical protein ACJX0J_006703, partial [Zea mays]